MKKHIILVCVILFSIGLLSTVFSSCRNQTRSDNNVSNRDRDYVSNNNVQDRDSNRRIGSSSICERTTRKGGGSCDNDDECLEQCDDLFGNRDAEDCIDQFSVNEVQGMWYAFVEDDNDGILEDPEEDTLENIHPEDIKNALSIDDNIWDSFINGYRASEAKDVLYWIANDKCIYEAISDSFDADDTEGFIVGLFEQADNSGLISAALEPLGREAKDDETFLYIAHKEGNDNARDLVHELLWEECLSDKSLTTAQENMYNDVEDEEDRNSACLLGELYCKQVDGDYIFEDIFAKVVKNELDDYIRRGKATNNYMDGLGISNSDSDDLEEVCTVICGAAAGGGILSNNTTPSTCP